MVYMHCIQYRYSIWLLSIKKTGKTWRGKYIRMIWVLPQKERVVFFFKSQVFAISHLRALLSVKT